MFQVVQKPWEIIFCFLAATKYDLGEVDKAMFLGVVRPCEIIFHHLVGP
jgi:hypothetical protein